MDKITAAYRKLNALLGEDIEPLGSVQLVEAYRRYWRPVAVRVILLAESHVFTRDKDRCISCQCPFDLPGYPTQYAKFVYCLGYGEKEMTRDPTHPRRDGTPQFWKILFSCRSPVRSNGDFIPILSRMPYMKRMQNKVTLLKELKDKGVWLVDASIVALYKDGKRVPKTGTIIEASWSSYTKEVVLAAAPKQVICIGKSVAKVVEPDLKELFGAHYSVVEQPNARLSSQRHLDNYRRYREICGV